MDNLTIQILSVCTAIIIPLLFVAVVIKNKDSRSIILYFCWGTLAGFFSYLGNEYLFEMHEQTERVSIFIAPIVEEFFKCLPLLLFLSRKRHKEIEISIIYCALAVGVAFSIQETIYYFSMTMGTTSDFITLIVRTLTTCLMHGMTTGIFGAGLFIMQKQRHILMPTIFGLLTFSTGIHAIFNMLLPTNAAIIAMLIPITLYIMGLIFMSKYSDQ